MTYPTLLVALLSWQLLCSQQTEKHYLSGLDKDTTVEWDFFCSSGMKSGEWSKIPVPSCWELQGFGHYNYGHDEFENRVNEHGLYKHEFSVPSDWKGKEIKLVFEGVMTDAEAKINGKSVGPIHQGAFYEFKYSITNLINFKKPNLLEVKVNKASANESINHAERKADFWIFGGIFRPVYLEAFPQNHIERVAIDAKADGSIEADVFVSSKKARKLNLNLYDRNGPLSQELAVLSLTKEEGKWNIISNASSIKPWNPEKPQLYVLRFDLLDQNDKLLHSVEQRIGFRTVEVREADGIYVNGQKIKFKGVNRHSFYPSSGRTTSKELSIEHVKMMKDMNMNAVRMSHYPPDVHFLEVCDSLGLFVIDEVCTWHSPVLDTKVGEKIVMETVTRDVNHPSILLWANGNETGWNTDLDDDYAIWDIQKREVIHPWNVFDKTNTLHYFRYHALATDGPNRDKILFPTEFLHGLYDGGHGAGLEDYWNKMWNMPLSAGGFLWDFADEAVVRTDKNGILDTDGNHAADGIVGPYGEKEGSYYTIRKIWSPIQIQDRFIREGFDGVFRIENRFHYTNLNECSITAKWIQFSGPKEATENRVIAEEQISLPEVAPGFYGSIQVELPNNWKSANALQLIATNPEGLEIASWTFNAQHPEKLNASLLSYSNEAELSLSENQESITVKAKDLTYTFSASTGILKEVKKGEQLIPLSNGPIILDQNDKIIDFKTIAFEDSIQIKVTFEMKDKSPAWASYKELSSDQILWTIHKNGLLDLEVQFKGKRIVKGFKGITFSYPESEVAGKKWLGNGPYRVWRNRMKGPELGVWENDYNNTITGESGFEYPEFKGYFSNLFWMKVKGRNENGFTVYCHSKDIFMRMLTPDSPKDDRKQLKINHPEGDISFVLNIPPIGTKFQYPETMGPQGNPENYFGNIDDPLVISLSFRF
ncbi:MAG: glycoside hydrolase family 2 TIM barrel-domain containing protein [Bacteroidota bacterium]